jgi:hypothetical protein
MSQVFVVQESRYKQPDGSTVSHDYSALYRYGPVIFLLPPTRKQMDSMGDVDELKLLSEKLASFNADVDYLVFSGDPVLCALAAITVYAMTEGDTINVLKWNRKEGSYDPVVVTLP